jgi:hypothetical protein
MSGRSRSRLGKTFSALYSRANPLARDRFIELDDNIPGHGWKSMKPLWPNSR